MSTWWDLECLSHDPPIRSEYEVEQHTYGLPAIRDLIAQRLDAKLMYDTIENGEYFQRNTARFLIQHPKCALRLVSEYGEEVDVTEPLSLAQNGPTDGFSALPAPITHPDRSERPQST